MQKVKGYLASLFEVTIENACLSCDIQPESHIEQRKTKRCVTCRKLRKELSVKISKAITEF